MIDLRTVFPVSRNRNRMSAISLRSYRPEDLEAMFRLDQVCFTAEYRFDRESMRLFAEAPNAIVAIAQSPDGRLAGFAIAHLERADDGCYAYLVTLDVAPRHRRQGLAGRLMAALDEQVRAAGARRMELHVSPDNAGALRFYHKCGYLPAGRQVGFYGDGRDALGYWKPVDGAHGHRTI